MNNFITNDVATVAPMTTSDTVKKSDRTSPPLFIIAETTQKNRRAEVLAAAYRYILSDEWGKV
jgi:hypothetical protein